MSHYEMPDIPAFLRRGPNNEPPPWLAGETLTVLKRVRAPRKKKIDWTKPKTWSEEAERMLRAIELAEKQKAKERKAKEKKRLDALPKLPKRKAGQRKRNRTSGLTHPKGALCH